jgi:hypothetical protein
MLATASLSALSAFELLHNAMGAGTGFGAIGSVFAFVFVYCIDLFINMTPRLGDKLRHRLVFLLVRGPLGLVIAAFIGLGTALHLNQDDINAYVAREAASQSTADVNAYARTAPQTKTITADNNEITHLTNQNSAMETIASQKKADWWQDMVPCHGSGSLTCEGDIPGWGPKSRVLYADYQSYLNNTLNPTEKANDKEMKTIRADIAQQKDSLKSSEAPVTAADRKDIGLAAQTRALLHIMSTNWVLWILPIVILAWDQTLVLSKVLFPRRRTEIAEQELREDQSNARAESKELAAELRAERSSNQAWKDVREEALQLNAATWLAEEKARLAKRSRVAQQAMAEASHEAGTGQSPPAGYPPRNLRPRLRRRWAWTGGVPAATAISIAITLALTGGSAAKPAGHASTGTLTASGGHSIRLSGGEKLTIPVGAISGNVPVTATYTEAHTWAGNTPVSAEVTFSTPGKIIGKPILSLPVSGPLRQAALDGALHVAFRSTARGGWTTYPATYDAQTHTMNAMLTHFSTWRFWTWDWASVLADISQTVGQWEGRRAASVPDCANGPATPSWYNTNAGINNSAGLVVRGCVEGHAGNVLDVELVNNRPYGLMLHYDGATVNWGWHAPPSSLADGLRDGIGDIAAQATDSLYLPPLSSASVGIMNPGNGANHIFAITPTPATILADALAMALGTVINNTASAASAKWGHDVFADVASGDCSEFLTGYPIASIPTESAVANLLTRAPDCIKDILTIAARNEIAQGDDMDPATITKLSSAVSSLENVINVGKWATIENDLGNMLDYAVDQEDAAVQNLGFGFSILSRYTYTGPTQTPTPAPSPAQTPTPAPGPQPAPSGTEPVATPSPSGQPATVYDNYGTAIKGYPVCRGNPANPESMPGGTVAQTFTVPSGIAALTQAVVQIDPDSTVTARATLSVNGTERAATTAIAAGDTTFNFGTVPVNAGDSVTLTLTMTATYGKIITVYSASLGPGQFTVTDSCPDGAANVSTTAVGLRSKILGLTS